MIKSILTCTDGSAYSETAAHYAVDLASSLRARLAGLHVLDSRLLEGPFLANVSGWIGAQPCADSLGQFRALMQENGKAMLAAWRIKPAGRTLTWSPRGLGTPARIILQQEIHTELVVLGLRGEHADLNPELVGRRPTGWCATAPSPVCSPRRAIARFDD
ncbi:MAG: universal stress protein [Verrucomicrobia bacterium]|nr:universal stress protein [Verrucomicrobiota bacterium]